MQIELHRLKANHLYTEGQILINDLVAIPYTVEHTFSMLPIGEYRLHLTKDKKRRRIIGIYPVKEKEHKSYFEAGHSYLSSKEHDTIIIGEMLIPGSVWKGRAHYDRLFDRIEKCEQRKEPITFAISDENCKESKPVSIWLQ